mgnify:CR=1 FL=1
MAIKCTSQSIINAFTHHMLVHGQAPKSVYAFCVENHWKEKSFYEYFSSFSAIEIEVFYQFYFQAYELLKKEKSFKAFDAQNKLLSFFYTFVWLRTSVICK